MSDDGQYPLHQQLNFFSISAVHYLNHAPKVWQSVASAVVDFVVLDEAWSLCDHLLQVVEIESHEMFTYCNGTSGGLLLRCSFCHGGDLQETRVAKR